LLNNHFFDILISEIGNLNLDMTPLGLARWCWCETLEYLFSRPLVRFSPVNSVS